MIRLTAVLSHPLVEREGRQSHRLRHSPQTQSGQPRLKVMMYAPIAGKMAMPIATMIGKKFCRRCLSRTQREA